MLRRLLLIGIIGVVYASLCGQCFADSLDFKIEDYIPDYFRDLEWKVNGAASMSGSYSDQYSGDARVMTETVRQSFDNRHSYGLSVGSNLWYDHETIGHFLNLSCSGGVTYSRTTSDASSTEHRDSESYSRTVGGGTKSEYYSLSSSLDARAGIYWLREFFVSGEIFLSGYYREMPDYVSAQTYVRTELEDPYIYRTSDYSRTKISEIDRQYRAVVDLAVGYGHIYEGTYASTALYIVEELRSHDYLLRDPTPEEVLNLSEIVRRNRLEHAVDTRIRRQESLDEILGFLADNGLLAGEARYGKFLVEDVWDYFPTTRRRFGCRASLGFREDYRHEHRENAQEKYFSYREIRSIIDSTDVVDTLIWDSYDTYSYSSRENDYSRHRLVGVFEGFNPLSRKWQFDATITATYVRLSWIGKKPPSDCSASSSECEQKWELETNSNFDLIYIANSRTSVVLSLDHYYYDYIGYRWKINLGGQVEYRLAIPTTLVAAVDYERRKSRTDWTTLSNRDRFSLSVAIEHYLY
ncbi:MAG: hypothetical protein AB1483_06255 [Candidatus Zixiibacteriota bacterium]